MTKKDIEIFFQHRPAVKKTVFATECNISHSTLKGYILNGRISEENATEIDRIMRSKYNYDYKQVL